MLSAEEEEHGVAQGVYDNIGGGVILVCLCNYGARGANWEEAGAELDAHLEDEDEDHPEDEV